MTGFIFLDKPEGITSFTAVNKVRRITGVKKAGHTGTLDPYATGVLPVMLGGATRFSQFLPVHDKAYRAGILLGTVTDTLDTTGEILEEHEVNVTEAQLEEAVFSFRGEIKQLPPMYSAVSKDGVRLYKLARQGIEIEREARDVTIYDISIAEPLRDKRFVIDVSCSAGTYIRSLADDIGRRLGCGAVICELRRTSANSVGIEKTVTLEKLQQLADGGRLSEVITPCDEMLSVYPCVSVSDKQAVRFRNGGSLALDRLKNFSGEGLFRVYAPDGAFLGLGNTNAETGELDIARLFVSEVRE